MTMTQSTGARNDCSRLHEDAGMIHRLRLNAQQELETARRLREEAQHYHRETIAKARSEAQQLILKSRLRTQREVEELVRKANEDIQKVLADIRIVRITAQEELAAQRKFTDAARLCSLSQNFLSGHKEAARKEPDG